MRKVACLAVFMALMMLVPVQAGENVSIQQSQPQDDNRQPSEENKTLYMFWNDSNTNAWTHFQSVDNSSLELYSEEVDNGYGISHYRQLKNVFQIYKIDGSNNVPFLATECLHTLKLIHSIYASVETGRKVSLSENLSSKKLGL